MSLGKNIQRLRKEHHMTQNELAQLLHVSRQAISKWEAQDNEPDIKTIKQLSQIFHISIDELLSDHYSDIQTPRVQNKIRKKRLWTTIVIVFISIGIISALARVIDANHATRLLSEPVNQGTILGIAKQIDKQLVRDVLFDVRSLDFVKQKMVLKGVIDTSHTHQQGSVTLFFQDGKQETLDVYMHDRQVVCEKEVDAKDIVKIKLVLDDQEVVFNHIAFPIKDYMYALDVATKVKATSNQNFLMKLELQTQRDCDERYFRDHFDQKFIISYFEDALDATLQNILPIKMILEKDGTIIKEWLINDLKDYDKEYVVDKRFDQESSYQLSLLYETPLKQQYKKVIEIENFNLY